MTKEEYEAKRAARYARLLAAAERAQKEGDARSETGRQMFQAIPLGQPILIGHYSERRDRRYRERADNNIRKGYELHQKAEEYRSRAASVQSNDAIFSDDPEAAEKLEDKIAKLVKRQELMKAANKLIKKNDRVGLAALGFSEKTIERLFTPDYIGRLGFPSYEITNNGANIRRLQTRLATIKAHADDVTSEIVINGVTIVDNVDENRVQIFFGFKPDEATRDDLKRNGFHYSEYNGKAWQRMRGAYPMQLAKQIVEKHIKPATEEATS